MSRYQIVNNRLKLSDERFDQYLDESLTFFSCLESIAGSPLPNALNDSLELISWRNQRWGKLRESIENCRHKIRAVNYNLSLIKSEIESPPIVGHRGLPINLEETEFLDDVILFEFESFLFQVISTLDIFINLLELFYPESESRKRYPIGFKGEKGKAGIKTVRYFKKKNPALAKYIRDQSSLWVQRVSDLRNSLTHQSRVRSLQMFTINSSGIHLPRLDDQVDLFSYCKSTYDSLKTFIFDVETRFLLPIAGDFYQMKEVRQSFLTRIIAFLSKLFKA